MIRIFIWIATCGAALAMVPAHAADLYSPGNWPALAADRTAHEVGDALTIIVYESASATNSTTSSSKKGTKLDGAITAGGLDESGNLGFGGSMDNSGATGRAGKMAAQISAVVSEVLPNGDLRISGEQVLNVNGERTRIRVRGRVRTADISPANTVLSSRLADAAIDYNGSGFVSRSGKPGLITRIFNWLGLL